MTQTNFDGLGLAKPILQALKAEGYETPTPIQAQAIPSVMAGQDLLGIAQTGTGKTAAFALPILHRLQADRKRALPRTVRCLVLSPTRELASQIAESFKTYGAGLGFTVATVFGGVKYGPQIKALQGGLDILVATPGRLQDHMQERMVDLSATEIFVLDEADQMLDLGFVKPIRQIASRLPVRRQNLFFSATMPTEIGKLAAELLKEPVKVEVKPAATTAEKVTQQILFVETARKRALLSELFADESWTRTLVFARTKHGADRIAGYLEAGGVPSAAIHGNKTQSQRERALDAFKAGKIRALVATDIAARGIDVDGVTHVVNYDLPQVPEAYVHRIGRTARAGASGIAVSLVANDERNLLKAIEKVTRQRIPSWDRRNDNALRLLDEAIMAANPQKKATLPEREEQPRAARGGNGGRGRRPQRDDSMEQRQHRDGSRPEQRAPRSTYNPLAAERGETSAAPTGGKPDRNRRPSGGGQPGGPNAGGPKKPYAGKRFGRGKPNGAGKPGFGDKTPVFANRDQRRGG